MLSCLSSSSDFGLFAISKPPSIGSTDYSGINYDGGSSKKLKLTEITDSATRVENIDTFIACPDDNFNIANSVSREVGNNKSHVALAASKSSLENVNSETSNLSYKDLMIGQKPMSETETCGSVEVVIGFIIRLVLI